VRLGGELGTTLARAHRRQDSGGTAGAALEQPMQ
jgi:hypothetical protein